MTRQQESLIAQIREYKQRKEREELRKWFVIQKLKKINGSLKALERTISYLADELDKLKGNTREVVVDGVREMPEVQSEHDHDNMEGTTVSVLHGGKEEVRG